MAQIEIVVSLKMRWWFRPAAFGAVLLVHLGLPLGKERVTRFLMRGLVPVVT